MRSITITVAVCLLLKISSISSKHLPGHVDDISSGDILPIEVNNSSCIGVPPSGNDENSIQTYLHLCGFFGHDGICLIPTTLKHCCADPAVTDEMARAIESYTFTNCVNNQTTAHSLRFYKTIQGPCYYIEPTIALCFSCTESDDCSEVSNPYCAEGVDEASCMDGDCECKDGFTGSDCCSCSEGFFPSTSDPLTCQPCGCCSEGVVGDTTTCDNTGTCGECKLGFFGRDCCQRCECCSEGVDESQCDRSGRCVCAPGYTGDRCCEIECNCCEMGTLEGSECRDGVCTCKEGFMGNDCCEPVCDCCANGTMRDSACFENGTCNCVPGFMGDRCCEKVPIACGDRTDFYFLLDATLNNFQTTDICVVAYTFMEITTVLNVGSGKDQTLVGFILYPDRPEGSANFLIEIGDSNFDTCDDALTVIGEMIEVPFRIAGQAGYSQPYPFPIRRQGVRAQPATTLRLLKTELQRRTNTERQSVAILMTGGNYNVDDTNLQDASDEVNNSPDFDIIAAGFASTDNQTVKEKLKEDLQTIAGAHNHTVFSSSANSLEIIIPTLRILEELTVICPNKAQEIIDRITAEHSDSTGTKTRAEAYCNCVNLLVSDTSAGADCTQQIRLDLRPSCNN